MDHSPFINNYIVMETIDLRKKPKAPFYPQSFIAHYCGHHMTCGNTHSLFLELQILEELKTQFENNKFDYEAYCRFCWAVDIKPANEYRPMEYFDAYVHIGIGNRKNEVPDITVYNSRLKNSVSLTMVQMSVDNEMYSITLPAYDMKHAYEQIWAICKENFG